MRFGLMDAEQVEKLYEPHLVFKIDQFYLLMLD